MPGAAWQFAMEGTPRAADNGPLTTDNGPAELASFRKNRWSSQLAVSCGLAAGPSSGSAARFATDGTPRAAEHGPLPADNGPELSSQLAAGPSSGSTARLTTDNGPLTTDNGPELSSQLAGGPSSGSAAHSQRMARRCQQTTDN